MSKSSSSEAKLLQKLKEENLKKKEKKLKMKEMLKANETAEEKRQRRLEKKIAKERKRKELMGWDEEYAHYTNNDNPFGDANLLKPFVWGKKLEKEGVREVSMKDLAIQNRHKHEENKKELEKVKKRREDRERERKQHEEEAALQQREKEALQMGEWHRQEEEFHSTQAKLRSRIRIQNGRAKPIDFLIKYINNEEDDIEIYEPYTYLQGLQIKDLEDLLEDIKVYKELDERKNLDYWHDLTIIVEDELNKLREVLTTQYQVAMGRREEISKNVLSDITKIIKGKTASELERLKIKIEDKINTKGEGIDIGYWENLLSHLKAHMARARLRDQHKENLKKKLDTLKAEQGVKESMEADPTPSTSREVKKEKEEEEKDEQEAEQEDDNEKDVEAADVYDETGYYEPKYIPQSELKPGTIITLEEDDIKRIEFARDQVINTGRKIQSIMSENEKQVLDGNESLFSVESTLEDQVYLWSDKYRPRKPRYFNRVHTGFEWNKYNQTHYDIDNPPPKVVQGYKFNIFYPDLIDKNNTPKYYLTACKDNKDFAILRFEAGPPYEDIAFKVVNREWEYSYKRGFRCQFHNNVFQLWFHFKRYRYRR